MCTYILSSFLTSANSPPKAAPLLGDTLANKHSSDKESTSCWETLKKFIFNVMKELFHEISILIWRLLKMTPPYSWEDILPIRPVYGGQSGCHHCGSFSLLLSCICLTKQFLNNMLLSMSPSGQINAYYELFSHSNL